MSHTPRVDGVTFRAKTFGGLTPGGWRKENEHDVVEADFARQLERELASVVDAAKDVAECLRSFGEGLDDADKAALANLDDAIAKAESKCA